MDSRAVKSNSTTLRSLVAALGRFFGFRPSIRCLIINELPNEMLRAILRRVPAHHLIRLSSMSRRWNAVIEDICRDKKCLGIVMKDWNEYHLRELSYRFNGHLKLSKDVVFIQANSNRYGFEMIHLSAKMYTLLAKLFPRIEQLHITRYHSTCTVEFNQMLRQWSSTLNTLLLVAFTGQYSELLYEDGDDFCAQINQLTSLRRLDFTAIQRSIRQSIGQLAPTFSRLEHISGMESAVFKEILPFLGTKFYSLETNVYGIDNLSTDWSGMDARLESTLARLSLCPSDAGALQFVCKHFASLQMLRIRLRDYKLTTDTFKHLAQLAHLTELRFERVHIDLTAIDVTKLSKTLHSIRILSLVDFYFVTLRDVNNAVVHFHCLSILISTNFVDLSRSFFPIAMSIN